ncbi:hypothetical protein FHR32_000272 [Streptosporangium album]|uniref:Chitinase n=1 Tax=Streptosporangium album TaxID=47479 RepID=A0A7W7W668_9ACTN|nr:hypothetical protein [Streptosporangium album]MBB4935967.1 hypothetical protein [Streptosporangium album]
MSVATDHSAARRPREPGTPPRAMVVLAAAALVTGTGLAVWLLPATSDGWTGTGRTPHAGGKPPRLTRTTAGLPPEPAPPPPAAVHPSGFVAFVDTVRDPLFNLPRAARQEHVRWFTLGHLTAGQDGCTPVWGGLRGQGGNPVATVLGRLRAAGGDAGLAFGGRTGSEPAVTCADLGRLTAAYRQVVAAFGVTYLDFEVEGADGDETVLRRAGAIRALQREAAGEGRPLTVSFTLPVNDAGLTLRDQAMLRSTREAGVEIAAVNLLAPIRRSSTGRTDLHYVASAVRAAHSQLAQAMGEATAWHRIALTAVLSGSRDLTVADARRLTAFTTRNGLAWLSTRGAAPAPDAARLLAALTR